jgi:hypothetical protein
MSRPKPKILLQSSPNEKHNIEIIIETAAIYAVYYKGKPINIKYESIYAGDSNSKYKKTSFPSKAHAINLRDRLNKMFNTTDFTVVKLQNGNIIDN